VFIPKWFYAHSTGDYNGMVNFIRLHKLRMYGTERKMDGIMKMEECFRKAQLLQITKKCIPANQK
jgi:hypothetical protein